MKPAIVIPSLEPNFRLIELIKKIVAYQDEKGIEIPLIVVNDGSDSSYDYIYEEAKGLGCFLLKHATNLGKGRALKTAFNYYLDTYPDGIGLVSADSDGQHDVEDIFKCLKTLEENPNKLVLGVRTFDDKSIPLRSRFGNTLTQSVFKFLCGVDVQDTQTGLRGIPANNMKDLLVLSGERFDYEMNMLIETKKLELGIIQVPIKTIYIENNETSHFNPITDSIQIYSLFFKFIFSSMISFVLDIVLFSIFMVLFRNFSANTILISTILARVGSSIFNFKANQKMVFQNKSRDKKVPIKYFSLVVVQMLASALLVTFLASNMNLNVTLIKVFVDLVLFLLSFQIQQRWIFI